MNKFNSLQCESVALIFIGLFYDTQALPPSRKLMTKKIKADGSFKISVSIKRINANPIQIFFHEYRCCHLQRQKQDKWLGTVTTTKRFYRIIYHFANILKDCSALECLRIACIVKMEVIISSWAFRLKFGIVDDSLRTEYIMNFQNWSEMLLFKRILLNNYSNLSSYFQLNKHSVYKRSRYVIV